MIALAFALLLVSGLVGWTAGGVHTRARTATATIAWIAALLACAAFAVLGALGIAGRSEHVGLGSLPVLGAVGLSVDRLSGLFLVITFGAAALGMLCGLAGRGRSRLPAAAAFVAASAAVVILADDLFLLLAGWEALGFSFYLAVGFDRSRPGSGRASLLAAAFSKVSGALLLLGGGLLAVQAGSISLADLGGHAGPVTGLGYTLLIAGFAVKVGLVPAHVWLPPAYAAAPGPLRALLAGAAVNAGFYGLWRTLDVLGAPPVWLACVVLLVAGLSALLGISHAAVHADLRGMIAWSSVENAGVITAGYGVALVGSAIGSSKVAAVGLLAGTMQIVAHAAAKSLLFVSTAAIEDGCGTTDLDRLRGVSRRMPVAGLGLTVGALTLAGMPLTAGFASEWMTLEALMQQFRVDQLAMQLSMAVAGILVALTVGVAGVAFVRLIGLTAFGRTRPDTADPNTAVERSWAQRGATLGLAVVCLAAAAFAPFMVSAIGGGLEPIVGRATFGALVGGWILQPVFADFSALSPTWLWIVIPGYAALIVLIATILSGRRFWRVRRVAPWTSAGVGVPGRVGYTSYAYANPVRRVLAGVLLTRRELRELAPDDGDSGPPLAQTAKLGYTVDVSDVFQRYLYRPLLPFVRAVVRGARRLQSGRLDAYMAYMLVALLAIIAVVTALTRS